MTRLLASRQVLYEETFGRFRDSWLEAPELKYVFAGRDPRTDPDPDWLEGTLEWADETVNVRTDPKGPELRREVRIALVQNPNFPIDTGLKTLVQRHPEAFVRGNPSVKAYLNTPRFWDMWGCSSLTDLLDSAVRGGFFKEFVGRQQTVLTFKKARVRYERERELPLKLVVFEHGPVGVLTENPAENHYCPSLAAYAKKSVTTAKFLQDIAD